MVMVTSVVMAAWHVMGMAVRGMIGAMVGLSGKCPGTMLDGLDCGGCGQ